MAKAFKYIIRNEILDAKGQISYTETPVIKTCSDADFSKMELVAKAEAYNSEYTIEDVPDQPHEPTEVERLSSKLDAVIQSNAMLEDCLVEMAGVVYA